MIKIFTRITECLSFAFVFCLVAIPTLLNAQAPKAALNGSFLTEDLCGFWPDARWQKEFTALKNAGMHYIILSSAVFSAPGEATQTIYPSKLPNTIREEGSNGLPYPDIMDACLRNAQAAGIKVFIGIDLNDRWWSSPADDSTWLYSQMDLDNSVCDELWQLYKNKYPDAFYGWYWAYEIDNVNFKKTAEQTVLTNAMNRQLDHLTAANEKLPFMWCPFMNSSLGTPAAYETMWKNVFAGLHTSAGDIFCPQDCVGAGGIKLTEVTNWFSALRAAVATKPGLLMWSDVETFTSDLESSATMDRIITQLKTEQPYVDDYVSWEYCYYDSPNNTDPGFQATYIDYLNNGVLETTAPTAPATIKATLKTDGTVDVNWSVASDNIGVCGYYLYRNNTLISKTQVPKISDSTSANPSLTAYTDKGLSSNTTYTYTAKSYDFAANVSAPSPADSITTGNLQVLSHGCSYKCTPAANASYPDSKGKKLTDGLFAPQAYYADPAWVGFGVSSGNIDVVIDLGKTTSVKYFIAEYLLDPQPAVYLPTEVKAFSSVDNTTFTEIGTLTPSVPIGTTADIYQYYYTLSNPINARYIKFTTTPSGYWTFCDELEVLNNVVSGIKEVAKQSPRQFTLSDAYPNPFNPSTNIKYSVEQSGMVSLKIYNVMGQLVQTVLDNVYRNEGDYNISITMDKFTSGIYFYTLIQGKQQITKKMVLMK